MQDWLLQQIQNNWGTVLKAPGAFIAALALGLVVAWVVAHVHYRERLKSRKKRLKQAQEQLQFASATIIQKEASIKELTIRLEQAESNVRDSVSTLQSQSADNPLIEAIKSLQGKLVAGEAPLLEFEPYHLSIQPLSLGSVRIQFGLEVRNLGAPTALHGWQAAVKLSTHSCYLTERSFGTDPIALDNSNQFMRGTNLIIDDRLLEKGGKRVGWVDFTVAGEFEDGKHLEIRRVTISVCDYKENNYSVSMPPDSDLPGRQELETRSIERVKST